MKPKGLLCFFIAALTLTFFSSCRIGKNTFGGSKSYISAESGQELLQSTDIAMSFNAKNAVVDGSNRISLIQNQIKNFSFLTAPFDLTPDDISLGLLFNSWIELTPSSNNIRLTTGYTQGIHSNSTTFVFLVKNGSAGDIVSLNPFDPLNQSFELNIQSPLITAKFKSSVGDEYQNTTSLPSDTNLIIAASFSSSGDEIHLSIQGGLQQTISTVGNPSSPFLVDRMISLGSSTLGQKSIFKEGYVFSRALSKNELASMILLVAQNNNISITLDPSFYKTENSNEDDPKFKSAQAVIQNKCVSCHTSWSNVKAQYYTNNNLVLKNDPNNSPLYYRIYGSRGANGPKNMPLSGAVTDSDLNALSEWINSLN